MTLTAATSQWRFEVFRDASLQYRWRLLAASGQVVTTSGEGYVTRAGARHAAESVKRNASAATVVELEA